MGEKDYPEEILALMLLFRKSWRVAFALNFY